MTLFDLKVETEYCGACNAELDMLAMECDYCETDYHGTQDAFERIIFSILSNKTTSPEILERTNGKGVELKLVEKINDPSTVHSNDNYTEIDLLVKNIATGNFKHAGTICSSEDGVGYRLKEFSPQNGFNYPVQDISVSLGEELSNGKERVYDLGLKTRGQREIIGQENLLESKFLNAWAKRMMDSAFFEQEKPEQQKSKEEKITEGKNNLVNIIKTGALIGALGALYVLGSFGLKEYKEAAFQLSYNEGITIPMTDKMEEEVQQRIRKAEISNFKEDYVKPLIDETAKIDQVLMNAYDFDGDGIRDDVYTVNSDPNRFFEVPDGNINVTAVSAGQFPRAEYHHFLIRLSGNPDSPRILSTEVSEDFCSSGWGNGWTGDIERCYFATLRDFEGNDVRLEVKMEHASAMFGGRTYDLDVIVP